MKYLSVCSLIWLKLRIKSLGLKRHSAYTDESTVKAVIAREIRTSHQLRGYRAMWRHITQKYNLNVKRFFYSLLSLNILILSQFFL